MLLTKHPFVISISSIGCELPLIGGWGVLYFSEWTQIKNYNSHELPLIRIAQLYNYLVQKIISLIRRFKLLLATYWGRFI